MVRNTVITAKPLANSTHKYSTILINVNGKCVQLHHWKFGGWKLWLELISASLCDGEVTTDKLAGRADI